MTSLKETIVEKFLSDLAAKQALNDGKLEAFRKLLAENPKVKADEFLKIFADDESDFA